MTKKYLLAIGCVMTFLCATPNLFAQIGFQSPIKKESIDFPCTKNGIPDGIVNRMQAGTSPVGPSFSVVNDNRTEDIIVAFPGNTITIVASLADQDKKCVGTEDAVFGKGPYKIEVDIMGNDAFFVVNQGNSFSVDFLEGTQISSANLNTGQLDIKISDTWNGNDIKVLVTLKDLEEPDPNCATSCETPKDPDFEHQWTIKSTSQSCPPNLFFSSGHSFGQPRIVSVSPGFSFRLETNSMSNFENVYIGEEITDIVPQFVMTDIDQTWRNNNPTIETPQMVLDMFVSSGQFIGGGFVMESFFGTGRFEDDYFVPAGTIPLDAAKIATNPELGFCFRQDYLCNGNSIYNHFARFRYASANEITVTHMQSACP